MLKIAVLLIAGVLFLGFAYEQFRETFAPEVAEESVPSEVACTMDALECPDGTYVGRTGPNCEFVCP